MVDNVLIEHLRKRSMPGDRDVHLSDSSPVGIPLDDLRLLSEARERMTRRSRHCVICGDRLSR